MLEDEQERREYKRRKTVHSWSEVDISENNNPEYMLLFFGMSTSLHAWTVYTP